MYSSIIVTVMGPNKPGLVNAISEKAAEAGANWAESRMANLVGQFAGIIHLQILPTKIENLTIALESLKELGLQINIATARPFAGEPEYSRSRLLNVELIGQDHPGIIRDISKILSSHSISIEKLDTEFLNGSWSGENMFQTKAKLRVPANLTEEELQNTLEAIANEIMVDISIETSSSTPFYATERRSSLLS